MPSSSSLHIERPFWAIQDGDRFLLPFGKRLQRTYRLDESGRGRYVLHASGHFVALRGFGTSYDIRDKNKFSFEIDCGDPALMSTALLLVGFDI